MLINFDVNLCVTGEVAFTAKIECSENESHSTKLRLAVVWALENDADLSDVSLSGADLSNVDLSGVDLSDADLSYSDLSSANLSNVNFSDVNLFYADLSGANLSGVNLSYSNLCGADLSGSDLSNVDFYGAGLFGANLSHANLLCLGDMRFIKTLQIEKWKIAYTHDTLQIGCQTHSIEKWKQWETEAGRKWVSEMNCDTLDWAKTHLNFILKLIEVSPAESPMGKEEIMTLTDNSNINDIAKIMLVRA